MLLLATMPQNAGTVFQRESENIDIFKRKLKTKIFLFWLSCSYNFIVIVKVNLITLTILFTFIVMIFFILNTFHPNDLSF